MTDNGSIREKRHKKAKAALWEASEPSFNVMDYQGSLVRHLNFFNNEVENEKKQEWTIEYWKSKDLDVVGFDKIPDGYFTQTGVLVRLISQGIELDPVHVKFLEKTYIDIKSRVALAATLQKETPDVKPVRVKTAAEKYYDKAREICSDIDAELDQIAESGKQRLNLKSFFASKGVLGGASKLIAEQYKNQVEELSQALLGLDPQLKEGYSHLSKKEIRTMYDFLTEVLTLCNQTVKTAKPRSKKEKPPAVVAAKVQYLKEYPELKMTSVHPSKIVGCEEVWLFNTKVRKLFRYTAIDGNKLTIKGTTLLNFDVEKSGSKTIRKPDQFFESYAEWTKRPMNKAFNEIRGVLASGPGRISKDMIILKCF